MALELSGRFSKVEGKMIMTRNEELLTVTDENEEKLRSLVEKAKTYAPELFQRHYKITPEEFEKRVYSNFYV